MTQFEGNSIGGLSARLRGEFYSRRDNSGTLDYVPHMVRRVTASGDATQADGVLLVDCHAGNVTISLPDAATMSGHMFIVKKVDSTAYTVTVDAWLGQEIDGAGGQTITTQYGRIGIVNNGVSWWIIMVGGTVNAVAFADSGALWALIWFGAGNGYAGRQRAQTRALSRGQLYLHGQTFAGR